MPEETGAEEAGDQVETVQVGELSIAFARQGSAARTAVLLHGFGGDLDNWLFNQGALSSDRTVIALELPGTRPLHEGGGRRQLRVHGERSCTTRCGSWA